MSVTDDIGGGAGLSTGPDVGAEISKDRLGH